MNWYRRLLAEAGFGTPAVSLAVALPVLTSVGLALMALRVFNLFGLAFAVWLLTLTVFLEWLRMRANRRVMAITSAWPEVIESMVSGLQSGLTVTSAIADLALYGPAKLRGAFATANDSLVAGHDMVDVLNWLKVEFSTEPSDRTIEILKVLDQLGGHSSIAVLSAISQNIRNEISFEAELAAKQGWVSTTAKLGLIAPWVVVLMLSRRPENALVYNSPEGIMALLGGLGLCVLAYLVIQLLATPVKAKRVFADAR